MVFIDPVATFGLWVTFLGLDVCYLVVFPSGVNPYILPLHEMPRFRLLPIRICVGKTSLEAINVYKKYYEVILYYTFITEEGMLLSPLLLVYVII